MEELNKFQTRKPDFKGNGIAVWLGRTKEGKEYLYIKLLNSIVIPAWKNEESKG